VYFGISDNFFVTSACVVRLSLPNAPVLLNTLVLGSLYILSTYNFFLNFYFKNI